MKFLEAHTGDRVIIGRFISPPSVKWAGFFLFIIGLICLIGVSASLPFILSTIGFTAAVVLAVLGITLGLAAMFAFQITIDDGKNFNSNQTSKLIKEKQEADIKFMDYSTVPPTEVASAKISGEGNDHSITINSQGKSQTIITDGLKSGMEAKVGKVSLIALPETRTNHYIYLNYLLSSEKAKLFLSTSNLINSTTFTISEGEVNTGLANKISDTKLDNLNGQANIGASNKIQSITVTNSGELNMGASNKVEKAELSINQHSKFHLGASNTLGNSNISVNAGEISGGASNKIQSITVTNSGKLNMGASNKIEEVKLSINQNSQLELGASNGISGGEISIESGKVNSGMSNISLKSIFSNKSGVMNLGMSNIFNNIVVNNTQNDRNFGCSKKYGH